MQLQFVYCPRDIDLDMQDTLNTLHNNFTDYYDFFFYIFVSAMIILNNIYFSLIKIENKFILNMKEL